VGVFASPASALGPGGWDSFGTGLNDSAFALNTQIPGQLIVGGRFTDAGGNTDADRIAIWDGTSWSALGPSESLTGSGTFVNAIAVDPSGRIFAGGTFQDAGGNPNTDNLAMWNGTSWQSFCGGGTFNGPVDSLQIIGSFLYVGGSFSNFAGQSPAENLIRCSLSTGMFVSATVDNAGDIGGRVQALAADAAGNLYAGGTFINLDGIPQADYVAVYNGAAWSSMNDAFGGAAINTANVDSLASDGTNIYVGSDDVDIASIPQADHVARWDGNSWSAVGSDTAGTNGYFPATATIDDLLVPPSGGLLATGAFNDANGDPLADGIAIFDGTSWNHLGSSADGTTGPLGPNGAGDGSALAFFGNRPVVAGAFTDAGGDANADRVAAFGAPDGGGTGLPAPVQGVSVNLSPVSGTVRVDLKGDAAGFIPLSEAAQVPVGSKVDTTKGRVALTSATAAGGTQTAEFYAGLFEIKQSTKKDLTTARLRGKQQCGGGGNRHALAKRKRKPKLWGSGSGNFSSSGNHGSASVRGTEWLIFEQCGGITGTTVKEGKVAFRNFYTGKTKIVKAPKTALAKPPSRNRG
jgi:hypothetical protein